MKHIIIDTTTNSDRPYIDHNGENCELLENAEVFGSAEEALNTIRVNDWSGWACVKPLNEC